MAYGNLRYSKKPFENAERYQYKTLLGKTRNIYCSGKPIPESRLDLIGDLIAPIGSVIVGIVMAVIELKEAGASAYLFQMSFTEIFIVMAVGASVILIWAGFLFWRIRRFIISRRYIRVFSVEAEEKQKIEFAEKGRNNNE